MDKIKADKIHADLTAVLKQFAAKHGLSLSPMRGNFTMTDIKVSFVMSDAPQAEGVNPEYVRNLQRNGSLYGLSIDDVGRTFDFGQRIGAVFLGLKGKKAVFRTQNDGIRVADAVLVAQVLRATPKKKVA